MAVEKHEYRAVSNLRAAAALLALLVCAFVLGASWLSWRDENARQTQSLSALAEVGAQSTNAYFAGLQGAMGVLSGELLDEQGRIEPGRTQAVLQRFKAAYPELRIVTVADLDGRIIASTEPTAGRPQATLAAQRTFIIARDERVRTGNRDVTIGRAFFGPLSREWVMPLGYGVWDTNGKLTHILGAGLPLAKPAGFWKDAPLPDRATLGLRRDDGYLLLRYPNPGTAKLEEVYTQPASGPLGTFLASNNYPARGYVTGASRLTGEQNLFVFRRLANFPLTFFVSNPTANIVAAWWERIWPAYVLTLLVLFGGYSLYLWLMRRQIAWESERGRQIEMLHSANQELEDFAYTIAHDLKAPVRSIGAHTSLALGNSPEGLPEDVRARLERVQGSAARMGELIDDLLEFSRYSRADLDLRPTDMASAVRAVVADLVNPDAGVDVKIGALPECNADPSLIRVVWTALLSNAVKFSRNATPPVIEIGFNAGKNAGKDSRQPAAEDAGEYFVRDNGVGFDMAHTQNLFGVFSRLHGETEFEGTGAGLAIARRIIERHGGRIRGQAEVGKGATFYFSIAVPAGAPVGGY